MRVLVVDDDPMMRSAVASVLQETAEVVGVADGTAALAAIAEAPTNLVLLDVDLPGMSGYELLARLRRSRDHADLAVVMLTARTSEADRVTAFRTGADGYLTKPYDAAQLRQVVTTVSSSPPAQRLAARQTELSRAVLLRQIEQHFSS